MSGEKIWPDIFQTNGGTYILDNQSGFYYHSLSMFYYEPTIDTVLLCIIYILLIVFGFNEWLLL